MPEVYNEKVLSIVLSITLLVSASAWAGVADSSNAAAQTTAIPIPSLTPKVTDEDMAQLFEVDGKPLQLAKLSPQELQETNGAGWSWASPWAPYSFAALCVATVWYSRTNSNRDKALAGAIMKATSLSLSF